MDFLGHGLDAVEGLALDPILLLQFLVVILLVVQKRLLLLQLLSSDFNGLITHLHVLLQLVDSLCQFLDLALSAVDLVLDLSFAVLQLDNEVLLLLDVLVQLVEDFLHLPHLAAVHLLRRVLVLRLHVQLVLLLFKFVNPR